jgi:primosomal protein N'
MILGFIVSKEGKLPNLKKIHAIINMPPPRNPQHIQVFNGMTQFYKCFIKKFVVIMAPITKLTKKTKAFPWIEEYQKTWELIKNKYIKALILISPNWQVEFHVHISASLLAVGAIVSEHDMEE